MINTKEAPIQKATPTAIFEQWRNEEPTEPYSLYHRVIPDFIVRQIEDVLNDSAAFISWLQAKQKESQCTVGTPQTVSQCPLANYLREIFPGAHFAVGPTDMSMGVTQAGIQYYSEILATPRWAASFICQVDHSRRSSISPSVALYFMSGIQPSTLENHHD